MSNFGWFGQTSQDIVNAYNGAVYSDFDPATTKSISGGALYIEDQMDLVEEEIVAALSPKALGMMQAVEYMKLPKITGSSYTLPFPVQSDLKIWQVEKEVKNCDSQYNLGMNSVSTGCNAYPVCSNIKRELCDTYLWSDYTLTDDVLTLGASFDQTTYDYYVSYEVDEETLVLNSLGLILRNRVACMLGMQLYAREDDTWKLVDTYCERGDKSLEGIDEHYLPAEFRKYKWLNSPFTVKGSISSIRIGRS